MQNMSSAVMQSRVEPDDSLDDFPTPPWATRALLEKITVSDSQTCREPTANRGHMVRVLEDNFNHVDASDIHDYGCGYRMKDYLFGEEQDAVDWTIFNPPFRLAEEFIKRAIRTSRVGVAAIVRSAFLESIGRYHNLFQPCPPTHIYQFSERVVMHKGRLSEKGSTATAYAWLVWDLTEASKTTQFGWIEPCRRRLERPDDYA